MITTNHKLKLNLFALIIMLYSCSKEDDVFRNKTANGKTSLFEKVTEAEVPDSNSEIYALSDVYTTESTGSIWGSGNPNGQLDPGILTAGEWNDLNNWDFWNNLLNNQDYFKEVNKWNLKEIKRYSFVVTDNNESIVANAQITLLSEQVEVWKTKTDATGVATLWSDLELDGLTARIEIEGTEEIITNVKEYAAGINKVKLNKTIINKKIVDIYFAVDATGSMGDEIDYLKAELNDVIPSK